MKCDYCGGIHHHEHCPNCGAPKRAEDYGNFRRYFLAACGFSEHYFGNDPPDNRRPSGRIPTRPQETITR